ncbi:MAG: hypothetical protein J6X65_02610 [Bacteroidales bacterium]|nr:hypothetical protein [Bacteroidales bacterium]
MKKFGLVLLVALLMGGVMSVSAQQRDHHGISVHVGGILPVQEFNNTPAYFVPGRNDRAFNGKGAAMFGASLGLKYNYVFDFGLGVFASADLMWNSLNKNVRQVYTQASCTKPMYVNVPIIVGANYITDFSDIVDVWGEAGIGCDLFLKTTEGWSGNTVKYNMNAAFAAEVGAGVTFIDLISVGVHYYWLGRQNVKVDGVTYDETYIIPSKLRIGQVAFKVGFHF